MNDFIVNIHKLKSFFFKRDQSEDSDEEISFEIMKNLLKETVELYSYLFLIVSNVINVMTGRKEYKKYWKIYDKSGTLNELLISLESLKFEESSIVV